MRGAGTKAFPDRVARHKGVALIDAEKAAKYAAWRKPFEDNEVEQARIELVTRYLTGNHGAVVHLNENNWFVPEEWALVEVDGHKRAVRIAGIPYGGTEPVKPGAAVLAAIAEDDEPRDDEGEFDPVQFESGIPESEGGIPELQNPTPVTANPTPNPTAVDERSPWEIEGISRSAWYRRHPKKAGEDQAS